MGFAGQLSELIGTGLNNDRKAKCHRAKIMFLKTKMFAGIMNPEQSCAIGHASAIFVSNFDLFFRFVFFVRKVGKAISVLLSESSRAIPIRQKHVVVNWECMPTEVVSNTSSNTGKSLHWNQICSMIIME